MSGAHLMPAFASGYGVGRAKDAVAGFTACVAGQTTAIIADHTSQLAEGDFTTCLGCPLWEPILNGISGNS